ncbi:uncharacterized protein [Diadema antillarum]|uniref:uncharacterized protein n=1 Tax=Diadema antillarum TaxID=105358 RepID=UPI003A87BDE8
MTDKGRPSPRVQRPHYITAPVAFARVHAPAMRSVAYIPHNVLPVRLVGGSCEREGRVEIRCDGQWGTVCDDCWDINNAHVVCRDLGYPSASAHYTGAHFGQGSGPIWLDDVICTGTETSLQQCRRPYWGCEGCSHGKDAGVRCEGNRTARVDTYNVRSELTLTPTVADHGGVLQCHLLSSEQSRTLQVQHPPADNIISIKIVDNEDGQETDGLQITCHVTPCDQPFPLIGTYEIAIDDVIQSSSSSPSVTLDPLPSGCVEISCTGINEIGRTTTTRTHCVRSCETSGEPPAADVLSIKTSEFLDKDRQMNLLILCRANLSDQSYPYLHSYSIGVDGTTLSNASWTSAVLRPRPNRCINVTCSATNGVGITSASARHCPRDPPAPKIISIKVEEDDDDWGTNLNISCHVDPIDQPFPPIGVFEIAADEDILSRSNASSTIMEDRPQRCIDISCTGTNQFGETVSTRNYCPLRTVHAPPANNILSIETQEINGEGSQVILVITCHISLQEQPYPHLHTYTIGVDNITLSSSSCASALFRPRPGNRCINVTCSGTNGIGWTYTSVEHCPTFGSEKGI